MSSSAFKVRGATGSDNRPLARFSIDDFMKYRNVYAKSLTDFDFERLVSPEPMRAKLDALNLKPGENAYRVCAQDSLDETEMFKRHIRGVLNKLVPTNVDSVAQEVIEQTFQDVSKIEIAVSLIFKKALSETFFFEAYVRFIRLMYNEEQRIGALNASVSTPSTVPEKEHKKKRSKVMSELVTAAQNLFDNLRMQQKEDPDIQESDELIQQRKKQVANIHFIGELFKEELLRALAISKILRFLLRPDELDGKWTEDERSVEIATQLLQSCGKTIDQRLNSPDCKPTPKKRLQECVENYEYLYRIATKKPLTMCNRIWFQVVNLVELREKNWQRPQSVAPEIPVKKSTVPPPQAPQSSSQLGAVSAPTVSSVMAARERALRDALPPDGTDNLEEKVVRIARAAIVDKAEKIPSNFMSEYNSLISEEHDAEKNRRIAAFIVARYACIASSVTDRTAFFDFLREWREPEQLRALVWLLVCALHDRYQSDCPQFFDRFVQLLLPLSVQSVIDNVFLRGIYYLDLLAPEEPGVRKTELSQWTSPILDTWENYCKLCIEKAEAAHIAKKITERQLDDEKFPALSSLKVETKKQPEKPKPVLPDSGAVLNIISQHYVCELMCKIVADLVHPLLKDEAEIEKWCCKNENKENSRRVVKELRTFFG